MDTQKLSMILNGVLVLALIVLVAFGYKEGNFGSVDKQTLQNEYITLDIFNQRDEEAKKLQQEIFQKDSRIYKLQERLKELEATNGSVVNEEQPLQCMFEDLSQKEQDRYILKSSCSQNKTEAAKTTTSQPKKAVKDQSTTKVKDTLTCKNHLKGSHYIPKECKQKLLEFIEKNSDAKRFSVVGIVDKKDFDLLKGLKNSSQELKDQLGVTKFQIKQFQTIAPLGLARARAKEAMQLLKSKLGKNTNVVQSSFELIVEDQRGFVIQAY